MLDKDWRPSPCPVCEVMREGSVSPICRNPECSECPIPVDPPEQTEPAPWETVQSYRDTGGQLHLKATDAIVASIGHDFRIHRGCPYDMFFERLATQPEQTKRLLELLTKLVEAQNG